MSTQQQTSDATILALRLAIGLAQGAALYALLDMLDDTPHPFTKTWAFTALVLAAGLLPFLWLSAIALAVAWVALTKESDLIFDWPGLLPLAASACALVATLLTVANAALLPLVLRSGRRLDSWTPLRRAGFTATVVVSLAFSLLLGLWGGLSPWAG